MSKKRKTRKEKMRATVRQSSHSFENAPVYTLSSDTTIHTTKTSSPEQFTPTHREQVAYAYVMHDARHTFIITTLLLASSIAFYFIIQNHIINLSFLGY